MPQPETNVESVIARRRPFRTRRLDLGSKRRGLDSQLVHALTARQRDLAYTTIMTVMSRLAEKGYLRRSQEGNAFRYWPTSSRQEFLTLASLEVFSGLAEDLSGPVLSAFVDRLGKAESDRLQELGRIIEQKRRKKSTGK